MEYAFRDIKWMKQVLNVFGILHIGPIRFSSDRKSAIYIAANPILHERTKHIKRDCHQVPDEVQAKLITTQHISSKLNRDSYI